MRNSALWLAPQVPGLCYGSEANKQSQSTLMLFPFALLAATVILARLTSSLFTSLLLQLNLTHSLCSVYFIPGPTSHYLLLIFSTTYQAGFANSEDLSQQGTYVSGHNDLVAVQLCGYHKCVCVGGGCASCMASAFCSPGPLLDLPLVL